MPHKTKQVDKSTILKTIAELQKAVKEKGFFGQEGLSGDDGNNKCHCIEFSQNGVNINTHCWRSTNCDWSSCIHIWVDDHHGTCNEVHVEIKKLGDLILGEAVKLWPNEDFQVSLEPHSW